MRKISPVLLVASCLALLITGCPKKGGDAADAEAEAAVVAEVDAAPAVVAPTAKNAGDIARFGTEKPIANEAGKLVDGLTTVRTGPRQGGVVASLRAGTDVTKIAEHKDCFLVTFADPKEPATTLMGWVGNDAFTADPIRDAGPKDAATDAATDAAVKDAAVADAAPAAVDAGPAALKCAAGQQIVELGAGPVCKKKCTTDKDCKDKAPKSCAPGTAPGGKVIHFCANE